MAGGFYSIVEGGRRGPFRKDELAGQGLRRDTLVWCKGLPDWTAAGRVAELLDVFDEPPPMPRETSPTEPALAQRAALLEPLTRDVFQRAGLGAWGSRSPILRRSRRIRCLTRSSGASWCFTFRIRLRHSGASLGICVRAPSLRFRSTTGHSSRRCPRASSSCTYERG